MRNMARVARKALKLLAGLTAVLATFALLLGGWGEIARAQYCDDANCVMSMQRAYDPAYQAAIHSGWYSPHQYAPYSYNLFYPYPPYTYFPYSSYPYQNYAYQYQYQYQYGNAYPPQMSPPYWMSDCMYSMEPCGY